MRSLEIWTSNGELFQRSGLIEGKKVTHSKLCKPKNVGKSNATTAEQQAEIQALNLANKKLKDGYFDNSNDALTSNIILPMLANDYFKRIHKLYKGIRLALQPKLDGVRMVVKYTADTQSIIGYSRKNRPINGTQHILDEIKQILVNSGSEDITFDGELYVHGCTFQEITKLIGSNSTKLKYHIYDVVDTTETFDVRESIRNDVFHNQTYSSVVLVETIWSNNLGEYYTYYIKQGYEGMMVRNRDGLYKVNGRSDDLLKYKKFIDIALPIHDITPNEARPEHGTVWVNFNGSIQKTGSKLSHADREELLTNKDDYIGKTAEIRYFEETDEGLMRFAYYHGIRIDK